MLSKITKDRNIKLKIQIDPYNKKEAINGVIVDLENGNRYKFDPRGKHIIDLPTKKLLIYCTNNVTQINSSGTGKHSIETDFDYVLGEKNIESKRSNLSIFKRIKLAIRIYNDTLYKHNGRRYKWRKRYIV